MRARLFVTEALRSITANFSTTLAATMTVLVGMCLLGLFISLGSWVVSWTDHVKKEVLVKVFFENDVSKATVNDLAARVKQMPEVKSLVAISPDEALREQKKKYPDLYKYVTENPLPWAIEITPKRAEDVETIAGRLDPPPAHVDKVTYGKKTTDRILKVGHIVEYTFLVAAAILLVASIILIANTIRLSIFARRREIEVMKLVGATNWFVRGPFMFEGLICGLIGSVIAVVLLLLGKELAIPALVSDSIRNASPDVHAWGFSLVAGILVAAGLVIGGLGSGITIRRFLRV
jgi:cell division transport system permease protein